MESGMGVDEMDAADDLPAAAESWRGARGDQSEKRAAFS
jgi:hypothetical protein